MTRVQGRRRFRPGACLWWFLTAALCLGLQGCIRVYDPMIFNHTESTIVVLARIDGKEERYRIAAKNAQWQGKPGRKLTGLRVIGGDRPVRDYDANFLDVMRANIPHTSEVWVIEPVGIILDAEDRIGKLR